METQYTNFPFLFSILISNIFIANDKPLLGIVWVVLASICLIIFRRK